MMENTFKGYLRSDGRKGIRNNILIVYTVECARHVASQIANYFANHRVQVIGFGGCAPNDYANQMMEALCTHPNVSGVLFVSLGCENLDSRRVMEAIKKSGRPVDKIVIQEQGGTTSSIKKGTQIIVRLLSATESLPTVPMGWDDLVIGTICGGSDAFSGLSANPAIGRAFDKLIPKGGTGIFEESGELIGCEQLMTDRAMNEDVGTKIKAAMTKAESYYEKMGHESFSAGNATGGLTTIEEKSLGAYCKSGDSIITDVIKPTVYPGKSGLYFLDIIPDGEVKWGFPNINDNAEIIELISCGSQLILFSTGRGSVVGSAISPVIKICSNSVTYKRMREDMDINAGKILDSEASLDDLGDEIISKIAMVVKGKETASEKLNHQEFALSYKYFDMENTDCRL